MADKKLRIVLELVGRGLSAGLSGVRGAIQRVTGGLSNMAARGGRFVSSLAERFYFLANSMRIVSGIARSLFERFIKGAGDALKLEAKLKSLTGSTDDARRVMDYLRQVSLDTGKEFMGLAGGASMLSVAAKDASGAFDFQKFQKLNNLLIRMSAFRPDLPIERLAKGLQIFATSGELRSLELYLDIPIRQLAGIEAAAEEVVKVPEEIGRAVTYVETGVKDAGKEATMSLEDLDAVLTKAGISMEMVQDMAELSGMERFNQTLADIARILGEPLFEALNDQLTKFADWLQENPEYIEQLANALGRIGATGIEKLFEILVGLIESIDFEKLATDAENFIESLASGDAKGTLDQIVEALTKIANFLEMVNQFGEKLGIGGDAKPSGFTEVGEGPLAQGLQAWKDLFSNMSAALDKIAAPIAGPLQAIQVDINLNSEMLEAQVRQTSRDVTTGALDEVGKQMRSEF